MALKNLIEYINNSIECYLGFERKKQFIQYKVLKEKINIIVIYLSIDRNSFIINCKINSKFLNLIFDL
jgi:hypothetical protein